MKKIQCRVWSGNMFLDGGDANIHVLDRNNTKIEIIASSPHANYEINLCTGLKDRHGTNIYEGDIIKHSFSPGRENIFAIYQVNSLLDLFSQLRIKRYGSIDIPKLHDLNDMIEIIGNIYENPELLNK